MRSPRFALLKYAIRRLLLLIPLLLIITFIVFVMLRFAPGDPAQLLLGAGATEEAVERTREDLGLNDPLVVQYVSFVADAVRGDLGFSYRTLRPVTDELVRTGRVSIVLASTAMVLAVVVGITVGIVSAVKQYSLVDNVLRVVVLAGVSMPLFWLGLLLIAFVSVGLGWLPAFGWGSWQHMILPTITLATFPLAVIARLTRSSMLEVMGSDYIRTARSNGLPERSVVLKHALKNAMIPVSTVIGLQFGVLFAGAILTETVFGIPGLGRYTVEGILGRDYPVVRGAVLAGTTLFVLANLVVDLLYTWLDPKQREMAS